jgi:hypothetical protein
MSELKVAPKLAFPEGAESRSYALVGMRGSGKSNLAVVMAERMHAQGIPWVALDPKGDWFGIKSSADGKGPGLPVVIFGGEKADVPLEPTAEAGKLIADLIVNEGITCVVDISQLTKGEQIKFLAGHGSQVAFAERLFRAKKRESDPIHMFLEEAHEYLPQNARGEVGKLIDAMSRFQTMGRQKGIGVSVLSQRCARVHKDVLNQVDVFIAFRTIAPHDREAIFKWMKEHAVDVGLEKSLPELGDGTAWVWSPEWLRRIDQVHFYRRTTYDSGSTPTRKSGQRQRIEVADVDIERINELMAATIARVEETDPAKLQRKIRELEAALKKKESSAPSEKTVETVEVEKFVFPVEALERFTKELFDFRAVVASFADGFGLHDLGDILRAAKGNPIVHDRFIRLFRKALKDHEPLSPAVMALIQAVGPEPKPVASKPQPRAVAAESAPPQVKSEAPRPEPRRLSIGAVEGGNRWSEVAGVEKAVADAMQNVLDSLAWLDSVAISPATRIQVAAVAKYHPRTGSYLKALARLNDDGLVNFPRAGTVELTDQGRSKASYPINVATQEEYLDRIYDVVGSKRAHILRELVEVYPEALSREELASRLDVHPRTGSYLKGLAYLRDLELVEYPRSGEVVASRLMFLVAV